MVDVRTVFPNASEYFKQKWSWVDLGDPQFSYALNQIMNTRQNLVIMGPGGTGKSILLQMAADLLGTEHTAVLSSTGISAANLSGEGIVSSTIHSFFRFQPLDFYTKPSTNSQVAKILEHTENILIDEVSMVNASLMECVMHTLEVNARFGRSMPRLILFGDVLQLPPVISRNNAYVTDYFDKHFGGHYMFFNSNRFQQGMFEVIHLKHIYRQKEESWQNVLNRIRMGAYTSSDLDMINSRVCDERKFMREHEFMMYLVPTNRRVDSINSFYYDEDDGESCTFTARQTGTFRLHDNPHLALEVTLVKGMQVMCLHNNYEMGYQNGTLGIIQDFVKSDSGVPFGVRIRTKEGNETTVIYEKWDQFDYKVNEETGTIEPIITGSFTQIGCKPAFACTVHKSQGLTLDSIYCELNGGFSEGLVYVGLSRCTSLEGIGLKHPLKKRDIKTSAEALEFLENGNKYIGLDLF